MFCNWQNIRVYHVKPSNKVFVFVVSVFTEVRSFVYLHRAAMLLPSGHTQSHRRTTQDMVILLIQDPFWVHLHHHVITMIQDETTLIGSRHRVTIQAVTKETDLRRGLICGLLIGNLGQISPISRAVIIITHHGTRGKIKTIGTGVPRPGSVFSLAGIV